jgi:hypothetical protein
MRTLAPVEHMRIPLGFVPIDKRFPDRSSSGRRSANSFPYR